MYLMPEIVLSSKIGRLEESATLALNARVKQLALEGKTVYNLTAGEPDNTTPEYVIRGVIPYLDQNKYAPVPGIPALRDSIAAHCRDFYSAEWIESKNIVVTAGAKPALFALMQTLLNPGDEVIILTPAWVSYQHMIELAGGVVIAVPLTDDFDINVVAVSQSLTSRTKAIIINAPNNPTGAIFSGTVLRSLAELLNEKGIFVISDDLYTKLVYGPFTPITAYGFRADRLLLVNGFSKSQALTGWRIGYIVVPEPIAVAATKILGHTSGNTSLPSQFAAFAALEHKDEPPMLESLRMRRDIVAHELDKIPQVSYALPAGAFYFFVDIRNISSDSVRWCKQLLEETGVAVVPGDAFFSPGWVRISFATDEETLRTALELMHKFIKKGH